MLEMVFQLSSALYPCIAHLTHLRTVELLPGMVVELSIKVLDELGVDEVQKCVSDVAVILCRCKGYVVVYGKVEEIELLLVVFLEALEQHILRVLVRNVADHDGGPSIVLDPVDVDHVCSGFLEGDCPSIADCWSLEIVVKTIGHLDHHGHVACRVASVHPARHLGSFCLRSCVASRNRVGTVLSVFGYDSHAGVDYRADHLILLLAFW